MAAVSQYIPLRLSDLNLHVFFDVFMLDEMPYFTVEEESERRHMDKLRINFVRRAVGMGVERYLGPLGEKEVS